MQNVMLLLQGLMENETAMIALVGIVTFFWRLFRKDKAARELQAFDIAAELAYNGVRNLSALYPNAKLDKAERGLELFAKAFRAEMGRDPNQAELTSAKMHFDAAHAGEAEQKAKTQQVLAKLRAAAPAPGPVASVPQMPLSEP